MELNIIQEKEIKSMKGCKQLYFLMKLLMTSCKNFGDKDN